VHEKNRNSDHPKTKRSRIDIIMEKVDKKRITEDEIIHAVRQAEKESEIIEAFKSVSEQNFRIIVERERSKKRNAQKVKLWLYPVISVAAVLLALLMLTIFKEDTSKSLYLAYFEMPESIISRGNTTFSDYYDKGLYKEALESINEEDFANDILLKFYVSVCYMKMEDVSKAKKYLSEIHKAYPDWQEVQWYLALCYLKEKQTDQAKELLQNIDDEEYNKRSKAVLGKLK